MTRVAHPVEVAQFREVLADRLGWTFDDDDVPQLARVLAERTERLRIGHHAYLGRLRSDPGSAEPAALAEELTITETYFFRYAEQFDALADTVLPRLVADRAAQRRLRLLSVGCSSGDEAYTMAITALRAQPDPSWDITVLGVDANPAALRRAAAGRYSAWSLRDTPYGIRDEWLVPCDDGFEVVPRLRSVVRFRQYNVVDDDILWHGGGYDVVFCRNLLMYLTEAARDRLVQRITQSLAPGGHLFLGHTDSLGPNPDGLEPQHADRTFYYRRPPASAAQTDRPRYVHPQPGRLDPAPPTPGPPAGVAGPGPAGPARQARAARPRTGSVEPAVRTRALSLLRGEQFGPALSLVEDAMPERPDPCGHLLHGVLLAHAGRLAAAEIAARQALDDDGLYADAHHLLAVCLEDGTAVEVALGHYRLAAHLDPRFAMPRLRLGLVARRRGDHRTAGTALESAVSLLWHETDERITLFGGGFGRSSLLALCRAELLACAVNG